MAPAAEGKEPSISTARVRPSTRGWITTGGDQAVTWFLPANLQFEKFTMSNDQKVYTPGHESHTGANGPFRQQRV